MMPATEAVHVSLLGHRFRALGAIITLTAQEVLRGRYVAASALGMAAALAAGEVGSAVSIIAHDRIVVDTGLAAMSLVGAALSFGVGQSIIARDLGRDGASLMLSQPLPRGLWLVARFLGVWAVVISLTAAMAGMQAALMVARGMALPISFGPAVAAVTLEAGVALAVSMVLACVGSRPLAAAAAMVVIVVGYSLDEMVALVASRSPEFLPWALGLRAVLPQLGRLNLRPWAARDLPLPAHLCAWAAIYAVCYSGAWLLMGAVALRRRR